MTENKRHLRDYSICLIVLVIADLFTTITAFVSGYSDGSFDKYFNSLEPADVSIAKGAMIFIMAFSALIIGAQLLIGLKGLKISSNPSAKKGHITAAKVFLVLSLLGAVSLVSSFFNSNADVLDTIVSICNAVLNVCCYTLFIKYANAVRQEAIKG